MNIFRDGHEPQSFIKQFCGSIHFPHDWKLDEKGHECRRCHTREEISHGQTFVLDPRMPEGELRFAQNGVVVGRITGLC